MSGRANASLCLERELPQLRLCPGKAGGPDSSGRGLIGAGPELTVCVGVRCERPTLTPVRGLRGVAGLQTGLPARGGRQKPPVSGGGLAGALSAPAPEAPACCVEVERCCSSRGSCEDRFRSCLVSRGSSPDGLLAVAHTLFNFISSVWLCLSTCVQ